MAFQYSCRLVVYLVQDTMSASLGQVFKNILFKFFFLFNYMDVCGCVHMSAYVCRGQMCRLRGVGVTGYSELPDAGN